MRWEGQEGGDEEMGGREEREGKTMLEVVGSREQNHPC